MKRKLLSALLCLALCTALFPAALAEEDFSPPRQFYDPDTMLWGLKEYMGDGIILPAEYDYIGSFTDGFSVARKTVTSGDDWHYECCLIDRRGSFVLPLGKYDYIEMGEDGIALVRDLEGRRAYFRPADSTFITDFCFLEDYLFRQLGVNKKLVDGRELYGAVDRNGKTVIPFEYNHISEPEPAYYEPHVLYAEKDGKYGAFNYDGSILRRCIYPSDTAVTLSLSLPAQMTEEEELNALIAASQTWEPYLYDGEAGNGLWGYKPTQYDTEYPPYGSIFWAVFASAQPFDETGHAQVTCEDGRVGTIDQSGNFTPAPLNDRFSDVLAGSWYDQGVTTCAEQGVMVGTGEGRFSPTAELTAAECLTLAVRLYDLRRGGDGTLQKAPGDAEGLPGADKWYRDAVYTVERLGLRDADGFSSLLRWLSQDHPDTNRARREDFAKALAVVAGTLEKKYDVPRIPDLSQRNEQNEGIYSLYGAGILSGTDSFGTFRADKELTRAECAVMVARVLDPTQRLTTPPATPNGYEQAVIDLRSGFTYIEESEKTYETPECTVFVYDRGGAMYSPLGNVTLIYKPGSALGDGTTIHCPIPNPMSGKHREPPEVMGLSEDGKTFTYTYYYEDSVHTCTVDLPSGKTTESDGSLTYENQMVFMTQSTGCTVDRRLDSPTATVVARHRTRSYWSREEERDIPFDDYELYLLSQGQNAARRLVLPSTAYYPCYYSTPTDRLPDSMYFSEDGKTFTYTYSFDAPLSQPGGEVLHEAGDYTYTVDVATGEVTASIDPLSQQNLAYQGILGSLETEEGYKVEYSYHSYGTFRLPDGVETVLRSRACAGDPEKRDYEFWLVRREGDPQALRLALPSTEALPDGSAPTTREPDSVKTYPDPDDPNRGKLAYTYRFTEPLWNRSAILHDKGTYTYTVDVTTGEQSVVLEDSYWKALADLTWNSDDRPFQLEQQLETEACTIVLGMTKAIQYPRAVLALVYKEGSSMGAGEVVYLPTLSGRARYDTIAPHSLSLNEEKTVLTYVYQFDENQYAMFPSGMSYRNHLAGTYTYTVDLATGEVTDTFTPKE